jgi:hypothetical protein
MDNIAKEIEVDSTHRYLVEYDNGSDFEWVVGDSLGFQATQVARFMNPLRTRDQYGDVFQRIVSEQYPDDFVGGWWKVERIFTLYLRLSGIPYKRVSLQGYSQGEWCEGIAYLPEGLSRRWRKDGRERLDSLISTMEDWWRGDVYQVTSQELVTYHTADGKKTYQRWEQVEDSDVFGGITGDITLDTCNEMFGY